MNFRKITDGVFYAGVNDRVTTRFEALWPIPKGVSYNAYVVKGTDKTALIDAVRIDEVREFLSNLKAIGGAIDYIVINHMEPDHSGSIPEVIQTYPNIKIVGNAQTIKMVKGYYHIDDPERFHEVKEGDTIDLGGKTLKFILTPMVHWPETMMTWLEEDKVIFTGDACGTFGALNGGVVDTEMDTDWYFPEMRRYYWNIVGKYSKFANRALQKLTQMELNANFICPTHGPVWHERIKDVIDLYTEMSSNQCHEGATIIYGSMYGNTAEMAEVIARALAEQGVRNIKIHNATTSELSDMITDAFTYKCLIVGCATYSMRIFPPVEAFLNAIETREMHDRVFATFGGYTWAKSAVSNELIKYSERMNLPIVATAIMEHAMSEESLKQARDLAKKVYSAMKS
ncbi:MAG: FprA family A-type flavoprotein [Muribaculaceae bacterium]|nr:FprA family A-type flavoprotein [Muribaculaceae bacterium]